MADALYLSLWYPNLRLEGLGDKLTAVLGEFARHGGEARVYAATVWPVSWHEAPVFQRVWGRTATAAAPGETPVVGAEPRVAVAEALELLHEDYAYEFQIGWNLWEVQGTREPGNKGTRERESEGGGAAENAGPSTPFGAKNAPNSAQDDGSIFEHCASWARVSRLVRVTGYGPLFDDGSYEQEGHIRIDFGSDAPFLEEEAELDAAAARHMAENVRQLVDLTAAVEKASGATARLLWSELGESLAQRLAERLGQRN
jgi:hypothetical protein